MWITQDPVGKGVEATERVVEYHIKPDELRRVAVAARDLEAVDLPGSEQHV